MSQRDKLRELDERIAGALSRTGLADGAVYDGATACTVYVDRNAQVMGSDPSAIVGTRTVVSIPLAQVAKPQRGRRLALPATGETFELAELVERDESRELWVAVPRG